MKLTNKYRVPLINLLLSVAISLIVNFSYFVFYLISSPPAGRHIPRAIVDQDLYVTLQVLYFAVLAFILLSIVTTTLNNKNHRREFVKRFIYCVFVTFVLYFLCPTSHRHGEMTMTMFANRIFNPMTVLKSSFTLIVIILYGKIYELVYQKQHIIIENELLKNENLQTKYDMLINQINPHFFFNSLNSLSMLVREHHNEKALTYIDQLSDTFRYIIQNGHSGTTTLNEELKFLDAYKYLHEIRYADKLFFDISVDDSLREWTLPSLSLQPLIENAVKHNSITKLKPLTISIHTSGHKLVVSNPINPKIDKPNGTGIGLKNLSSRYMLLLGKDIEVTYSNTTFEVSLPLTASKQ